MQFGVQLASPRIGLTPIHQAFYDADVAIYEFGIELDAFVGIDAGLPNFFDLCFGKGVVMSSLGGRDGCTEGRKTKEHASDDGERRDGTHGLMHLAIHSNTSEVR